MDEFEGNQEKLSFLSRQLLESIGDLQDTFTVKLVIDTNNVTKELKDKVEFVNNFLLSAIDSSPPLEYAVPRRQRPEDRVNIGKYEHSGFTVSFGLPDYESLKINVYGGLRIIGTADYRDKDITLQRSHTARTFKTVSKPTQINWHIADPTDHVLCEVWMVKQLTGFNLSRMLLDEKRVNVFSTLPMDYPNIQGIAAGIDKAIKSITEIVPTYTRPV